MTVGPSKIIQINFLIFNIEDQQSYFYQKLVVCLSTKHGWSLK